jgi:hypothetical protein
MTADWDRLPFQVLFELSTRDYTGWITNTPCVYLSFPYPLPNKSTYLYLVELWYDYPLLTNNSMYLYLVELWYDGTYHFAVEISQKYWRLCSQVIQVLYNQEFISVNNLCAPELSLTIFVWIDSNAEDLIALLDEHTLQTQSIRSSPHVTFFLGRTRQVTSCLNIFITNKIFFFSF